VNAVVPVEGHDAALAGAVRLNEVDVLLRLSGSLKTESFAIAEALRPCGPEGVLDGLARVYELVLRHYASARLCFPRSTKSPRTTRRSGKHGLRIRTVSSTTQ
jgi:hypothetical protein